ncbi:MAG: AAA family ATPase [Mycobacterium sp.]|nr:AAA family ATPase [Mycobacterium sp.]
MSVTNPDLVHYFTTGLSAMLVHKNPASAREHFMWCLNQIDDQQCDLYRALAYLEPNQPAPSQTVESMYHTLRTWGQLLGAVIDNGQPLREDSLQTKVKVIPELEITCALRIRAIAHIGYASVLVDQSRYADALEVIDNTPAAIPMVGLVRAYVFFKAQRWQDVIEQTQLIQSPVRVDGYGHDTNEIDTLVQAAAYLFSGISYAHLGNFVTAEDRLKSAESLKYVNIGAEACYYQGLIARAKGDEDTAAIIWNSGLAYARTDKLVAALQDPTIVLRLTTAELIKQRSSYWDVSTEPDLSEIREIERAENQNTMLAEAAAELAAQIGMTDVKEQVRRFKSSVAKSIEVARRGHGGHAKSMHMAFTGPPGTGKTTIARVVAKILCGLGLIKSDKLIEVRRAQLVGQVIGETEAKTNAVIDSALDGVLFIDEAYALAIDSKNDFGRVAVNEILARMENERDRLVVIIAGYPDDIKQLLATNDGLSSRFTRHITFSSYSPEEIGAIAEVLAPKSNALLPPESRDVIVSETRAALMVSDHAGRRLLDVAGNGRFVRNVLESAAEYRDLRHEGVNLQALSDDELLALTPEDITLALRDMIDPLLGRRTPSPVAPDTSNRQGDN